MLESTFMENGEIEFIHAAKQCALRKKKQLEWQPAVTASLQQSSKRVYE
jgi:hypothetical protein